MIKDLISKQVVCTTAGPKGKPCHGGLKRYYPFAEYYNEPDQELLDEIKSEFPEDLKCETCHTLYRLPEVLKRKFKQTV